MTNGKLLFWPEIAECVEKSRCESSLQAEYIEDLMQRDPPIPDEEIQQILFHKNSPLNFVKWKGLPLLGLSPSISNLTNLTQLVLVDDGLTAIPEEIGHCKNLKLVDFARNKLTRLPSTMTNLVQLESLILTENELTDGGLFDLSVLLDLHVLDISHNKLDSIPESLFCMESNQMQNLILNNNTIRSVPEGIESFGSHLRVLNLSNNLLVPTPYALKELHKLKTLILTDNNFEDRRFQKLANDKRVMLPSVQIDYLTKRAPKTKASGTGKSSKKSKNTSASESSGPVVNGRELVVQIGVSPSVKRIDTVSSVRPHIVCCILRNLNLSGENLKKFLAIQNKIHDSLCANRTLSSIGTHDTEKFKFPLNYAALEPEYLTIHPLGRRSKINAKELIALLTTEADSIRKQQKRNTYSSVHKYLNLVKNYTLYPCVIDADGLVMSMAPVTNSESTKLSDNESCNVFVEVTSGESAQHCRQVMDKLIFDTVEGIGGSVTIEQIKVTVEDGQLLTAYPDKNDLQSQTNIVVKREIASSA